MAWPSLVQSIAVEQSRRNGASVTQLIEAIGIGTHCQEIHVSGSNQTHTMNCIPLLVRHALSSYLERREQFHRSVTNGHSKIEQMQRLHYLTQADDVVGAIMDMLWQCQIVDEDIDLLDQLSLVFPDNDTGNSDAVAEYSERIQAGGSERSRLANRIGQIFAAGGGGPPSEPDSTITGTTSSRNTNPYDGEGDDGSERPNLDYDGDNGGDDDDDDDQNDTFGSGSMDPRIRLNEETRMLQVGRRSGPAPNGDQALKGYAPLAHAQREQTLINQSELEEWMSYVAQSKSNIIQRTGNETITQVCSPILAVQYWLKHHTRLNVKDQSRMIESTFEKLMAKDDQGKSIAYAFTVPEHLFSTAAKWDSDNFAAFIKIPVHIRMCMVMTQTALDSLEAQAEQLLEQDKTKYKMLCRNICDEKNGVRAFAHAVHHHMTEFVTYILRLYKKENPRDFDKIAREALEHGDGVSALPGMQSDLLVRELVMVLGHIGQRSKTYAPTLKDAVASVKNFSLKDRPDRKLADHLYAYYELVFRAIGLGDQQHTGSALGHRL